MTDTEFKRYLRGMLETPDCGVTPKQVARLFCLAGDEKAAAVWNTAAHQVVRGAHAHIRELLDAADARGETATQRQPTEKGEA